MKVPPNLVLQNVLRIFFQGRIWNCHTRHFLHKIIFPDIYDHVGMYVCSSGVRASLTNGCLIRHTSYWYDQPRRVIVSQCNLRQISYSLSSGNGAKAHLALSLFSLRNPKSPSCEAAVLRARCTIKQMLTVYLFACVSDERRSKG